MTSTAGELHGARLLVLLPAKSTLQVCLMAQLQRCCASAGVLPNAELGLRSQRLKLIQFAYA